MKQNPRFTPPHYLRKINLLFLLPLFFAGCADDEAADNALPEGMYPLQIGSVSLSVEGGEARPWTRVAETPDGMGSEFRPGDAIGVRLGDETATYTYDGSAWTSDEPLYWQNTQPATITAWYPVKTEIYFDQQDKNGLAYLLKGGSTGQVTYDAPANLTFAHQLAKVRVVLTGAKADDVANVSVKSYSSSTHTFGELGEQPANADKDYVPLRQATYSDGTHCWEATLCPGTLDANDSFTIAADEGDPVQVTLESDITLVAGQVHTININVKSVVPDNATVITNATGDITGNGEYVVRGNDRTTSINITGGNPTIYLDGATVSVSSGPAINITGGAPVIHIVGKDNSASSSNDTGIAVSGGATVTIEGHSTADVLTANGGTSGSTTSATAGAGIGSPVGGAQGGNIIIRNVTVHATGGRGSSNVSGAGIGSSTNGACGDITIDDAVIVATGGDCAAGIGMGCNYWNSTTGSIGKITIADSDVTASGGYGAAAIGFSLSEAFSGSGGTYRAGQITITTDNEAEFLSKLTPGSTFVTTPQRIGKGSYNSTPTFLNTAGTGPWEGVVINGTTYPNGVD